MSDVVGVLIGLGLCVVISAASWLAVRCVFKGDDVR